MIASIKREISPLEAIDAKRLQRFAWIRREKQFDRIESGRARFGQRRKLCFELRLPEPKIDKVFSNVCRKFGRGFRPQFAQGFAAAVQICSRGFNFGGQTFQLGVASFDLAHSLGRAIAKLDHFGNRAAIFAFQSFEKRNALFERGELFRIEIEFLRVIGKRPRDLRKFDHGRLVRGGKLRNGIVDLFQFAQEPLRFRKLRQNRVVRFGETPRHAAGQFDQAFAVARQFVARFDFLFFAGDQIRRGDLVDLMTRSRSSSCSRAVSAVFKRGVFRGQRLQLPVMLSIFLQLIVGARERIEQSQLFVGRKQRLVIVRPVKIDKFVAQVFQDRQGGGRAVDELAIGPARGKRSLQNQIVTARFDAGFDKLRI